MKKITNFLNRHVIAILATMIIIDTCFAILNLIAFVNGTSNPLITIGLVLDPIAIFLMGGVLCKHIQKNRKERT